MNNLNEEKILKQHNIGVTKNNLVMIQFFLLISATLTLINSSILWGIIQISLIVVLIILVSKNRSLYIR